MSATTSRPPFAVEVVRSARRKRTVGAQLVGSVLTVTVPSWMSRADEAKWVEEMTRRFVRRSTAEGVDLPTRAAHLAKRYDLPAPRSIKWVETMQSRWASCTPATGAIRVSSRVAAFPDWVRDYVIVHELAHLKVADHSPAFWRLVERYPKTERARGYLIAKSGDEEVE
jgi:predicted metal-dependent hydrolase